MPLRRTKSIRNKLRLMIIVTSAACLLFAGAVLMLFATLWFRTETQRQVKTLADMISYSSDSALDFNDVENGKIAIGYLRANPQIVFGCLYRTNGTKFAAYRRLNSRALIPSIPPRDGYNPGTLEYTKPVYNVSGTRVGTLLLQADLNLQHRLLWQCAVVLLCALAVASVLAVVLARKFQALVSEPILELLNVSTKISRERNYSLRAVRNTRDELGELVDAVNEMLRQIELRDAELHKTQGELEGRVAQRTDELRQAYGKLLESYDQLKKLEVLRDGLTNMLVHDLRSPLLGMTQMIEILEATGLARFEHDQQECVEYLHKGCRQLSHMIDSLLDVSRLEAGEMPLNKQECDIVQLAESAVELLRPAVGGRLVGIAALERPLMAWCDQELIRRVIVNLFDNALKNTPDNGRVEVSIQRHGNSVKVIVTDNGVGIPPEAHKRIFEKFVQLDGQRRKRSAGLGLAYCKLAVEAHQGAIGIESAKNRGSTFWFTLAEEQLPPSNHVVRL